MATTDLSIQSAVRDVILPLQRADTSYIVRQTTLSANAAANATSVTLTSLTGFGIGSAVRFNDTTDEETHYVSGGWTGTNPVSLDFSLLGYSGLQYAHPAGTIVYTNLFDFTPWDVAPGLANGDPVIFIRVTRAPYRQIAMPSANAGTFYCHLQYHRLLTAPGEESGLRINPNSWAERQEKTSRADLAIINTALLANQELIGENTPAQALQMSPLNQNGDRTILQWSQEQIEGDTWHFIGALDAIYAGVIS